MEELMEMLPFLIPIVIVELALFAYTMYHILTHETYKMGNRITWVIITVVFMNFIGPILYFILGKDD